MTATQFASQKTQSQRSPSQMVVSLEERLQQCSQKEFTGKLEVSSSQEKWSFFFYAGRLVWATGGKNAYRRFRRLWRQICPHISLSGVKLREEKPIGSKDYHILVVLSKRGYLTRQQGTSLVVATLKEVVFDILQQEYIQALTYEEDPQGGIEQSFTLMVALVRPKQLVPEMTKKWQAWKDAGLAAYSPNQIPSLEAPENLKKATSAKAYKTIEKLVDGQKTLREIGSVMNQEVLRLTQCLLPYIKQGWIALQEGAPDEEMPAFSQTNTSRGQPSPPQKSHPNQNQPLIACIDDSPQVCQQMQKILEAAGYRFVSVQDSVQAITMLLENKPDFVFLDLMMPVANGYEICSQIRRIEVFKDLPVTILTGNDGIVDRMRAKMVGATDFMSKPVDQQKVLDLLATYLNAKAPAKSE
ncbi:response regulator [Geitlerinema sp. PCC 9228]|jgi:chemotaxis family two-component system response regulator PixG|uniref:response regulator n=1 Tax=Geitlerinema sp. PCC 9228 TaxID=111611 RepID=UPI000A0278FF|nr:response regulator [Geitlerinema sp. PCC 9228]